ncbi:MAG TPA: alkaline phosphatase family protein [Bryobacteraceae bacterium]|nr:alkaline phosphatase family protein [Bryobacteraceae bacterium]
MGRIVTLFLYFAMAAQAQHVIVFGVDGLSVDGVNRSNSPRLHQMMQESAWTLEARGVMPTLSSPNWASMIDGAGPEQHGITSNGYLKPMVELQPVCRDEAGMFPTIFEVLRQERPAADQAVFHDWPGFANLVEKSAPDVLQHEHGPVKTVEAAMKYWREKHPELMFLQLDNVDHAGHASGWSSREYLREVEDDDRLLGLMLDMLQETPVGDSTFLLVTSDHGGKGRNHGKNSLEEIQIPWILHGPNVAPGRLAASVYTFDTAATIAWILGVAPHACWIGRPVMAAFQPAAITARTEAGRLCGEGGVAAPTGGALAGPFAAHGDHRN